MAKQMLEEGACRVNYVANAVGYEDGKYFNKEFKKTLGKIRKVIKPKHKQQFYSREIAYLTLLQLQSSILCLLFCQFVQEKRHIRP
ncbi:hypothetical protein SAMN05216327_12711 [Dyadobacter sp. SG02]|nr:hypothetical protein SAMN05216327_12711 [Dyadobacter sp. SG02]